MSDDLVEQVAAMIDLGWPDSKALAKAVIPLIVARERERCAGIAKDLAVTLRHAVEIIEKYVPADALGMNADGALDGTPGTSREWPLLDEYVHYMKEALSAYESSNTAIRSNTE